MPYLNQDNAKSEQFNRMWLQRCKNNPSQSGEVCKISRMQVREIAYYRRNYIKAGTPLVKSQYIRGRCFAQVSLYSSQQLCSLTYKDQSLKRNYKRIIIDLGIIIKNYKLKKLYQSILNVIQIIKRRPISKYTFYILMA